MAAPIPEIMAGERTRYVESYLQAGGKLKLKQVTMFTQLERYMVKKRREAESSQKATRELTGASERTIRRIEKEPAVTEIEEKKFRKSRLL